MQFRKKNCFNPIPPPTGPRRDQTAPGTHNMILRPPPRYMYSQMGFVFCAKVGGPGVGVFLLFMGT